jgi:hypothetical protein
MSDGLLSNSVLRVLNQKRVAWRAKDIAAAIYPGVEFNLRSIVMALRYLEAHGKVQRTIVIRGKSSYWYATAKGDQHNVPFHH